MGSERDRPRLRHLYVLAFRSGHVYVGQTVDPKRRRAQHRKAWRQPFAMTLVGRVRGTYAEAEHHEQAWRYLAHHHGFAVYASPDRVVINPTRRMTPYRLGLAQSLRWRRPNLPPTPRAVGLAWLAGAAALGGAIWVGPGPIGQVLGGLFHLWQRWLHG